MGRKGKSNGKKADKHARSNDLCGDCAAKCCHKLLIPFKKPKDETEIEYYKWHVQYDSVNIAIRANRWYVVIDGRCGYLDKRDLCTVYEDRPETCREHNPPNCEHYGEWYDVLLESPEELEAWFELEAEERAKRRKKKRKVAKKAEKE